MSKLEKVDVREVDSIDGEQVDDALVIVQAAVREITIAINRKIVPHHPKILDEIE